MQKRKKCAKIVLRIVHRWREGMKTVTVSPKFQVVIPLNIRKSLGLKPGQKVQAIEYENRIELIPIKPIKETRGFLKGIDTTVERDRDRL
jgi:AbrB family looped-hinge helix DNA binding protein